MPVTKFRSVEEVPRPWHPSGSPQLDRAVRRILELGEGMSGRRFPPGVQRFRSIEARNEFDRRFETPQSPSDSHSQLETPHSV